MENKQACGVNIVEKLELRKINAKAMHKSNRANPPRDVFIHEEWWHDKKTGSMMNEERFFTDCLSSINWVLDSHIIDVEDPRQEQEKASNVISP